MAVVTTVVDAARLALGPVGACLPVSFTARNIGMSSART
jgi:hypothetical protein